MWKKKIGVGSAVAVIAVAGVAVSFAARTAVSGHTENDNCAVCRAESALSSVAHKADTDTTETGKVAENEKSPVLVELFTSEGCSSCPPADTLLQNLQKTQPVPGARIIALSEHVDYWDRLGWKDPYSSAAYSARQSEYARSFKNAQVYTPQIVVDGQAEFVGSDRNAAQTAIGRAAKQPKAKLEITRSGSGVSIRIAALPRETASADVYAALTKNYVSSSVRSGENTGRRLTHTAVAQQLTLIGTVTAGKAFEGMFRPKTPGSSEAQSIVAFAQERKTRRVIAVGEASLGG